MYQTSKILISIFLLIVFIILLWNIETFSNEKGNSITKTIIVGGVERNYNVYRPMVPVSQKLPVMIVLHGGLGNADFIEQSSGMNAVADTGPFMAVYPNGTGGRLGVMKDRRTWNAGNCCGRASDENVNDVLFIEKMIDDLASMYAIDTSRIYVTGMSNGAMLAYRLACEIPERIAAIIPVSGTLAINTCGKGAGVPVMHIHGDQDENIQYMGGQGSKSLAGVSHRSIPDTVKIMTDSRQCSPPDVQHRDNIVTSSYQCKGAPFTLVLIKGGGHAWPGGQGRNRSSMSGINYSASEQAWNFARQFSKTVKSGTN
jgi:polyhydroxybutyrate depolymerase